ncbi:hypothetical protein AVEN_77799-1 [Araneus ventricosus]|uniref:Uncharacterized protein n=1 Tax=Araneus ventricosus TaxID=182803 RepID=A0A4Y2SU99_ARAVE|nr:hypothetical protein AVEN_77799-1 [Araneus ventricosus]
MDADAFIAEPIDAAAICANLCKQASQIKDLTNRINAVSRTEIFLSHDTITHQGLIKNMAQWQHELDYLKEQVSELCCPVVNCAFHNANLSKNQAKQTLSEISNDLENSKNQSKTPKNQNENLSFFLLKSILLNQIFNLTSLKDPLLS